MKKAGPEELMGYGRYLGRRFGHHQNIIWVNAGDANPDRPELVDAIAQGIRESDPDALQTAHGHPGTSAADVWAHYRWFDVNSVYSYNDPYGAAISQYVAGRSPFFLIESTYESESGATTRLLRTQAYHALLGGAAGQVFGNNPIWHFDGPGLHPFEGSWQDALSSPGTSSMEQLDMLFDGLPWWLLSPDVCGEFNRSPNGTGFNRTVAAVSADRQLSVVYTPAGRAPRLDLSVLAGRSAEMSWYDPTSGAFTRTHTIPTSHGEVEIAPPGLNAAGETDWVLIVQSSDRLLGDASTPRGA
jgi:hypothetical protein